VADAANTLANGAVIAIRTHVADAANTAGLPSTKATGRPSVAGVAEPAESTIAARHAAVPCAHPGARTTPKTSIANSTGRARTASIATDITQPETRGTTKSAKFTRRPARIAAHIAERTPADTLVGSCHAGRANITPSGPAATDAGTTSDASRAGHALGPGLPGLASAKIAKRAAKAAHGAKAAAKAARTPAGAKTAAKAGAGAATNAAGRANIAKAACAEAAEANPSLAVTNACGFPHIARASSFPADAQPARSAKPDADAIIAHTITSRAVTGIAGIEAAKVAGAAGGTAGGAAWSTETDITKAIAQTTARIACLTFAHTTRAAKPGGKAGAGTQAGTVVALGTTYACAKAANTRAKAGAETSAKTTIAGIAWASGAEPASTAIAQAGPTIARASVAKGTMASLASRPKTQAALTVADALADPAGTTAKACATPAGGTHATSAETAA